MMDRFDITVEGAAEQLAAILAAHERWALGETGGERAYLRDADLRSADLRSADLRGANLRGADLRGADLRDAYLRDADLRGAYLRGADLRGAYLRGAYLRDAYLRGAYPPSPRTVLDTGETWEVYVNEVVPQLLLAGERGLEAIRQWGKHSWDDCPMRVAFGIRSVDQAPALLRPRVAQFVQLYDALWIEQPDESVLAKVRGVATIAPPEIPAAPKKRRAKKETT